MFELKCVSICYINYSKKLLKVFISPTSSIRAHGGIGQRWQGYWGSFRSWSGNGVYVLEALLQMEQGRSFLQLEQGWYIASSKPIKFTQMILEKAQQRIIIANGTRQWCCVRFPWRIKVVWDWLVEAHGWCTSEGKCPLGKRKQVGLVHGPRRSLEIHKKAETHMWEGDFWVYKCEWSLT